MQIPFATPAQILARSPPIRLTDEQVKDLLDHDGVDVRSFALRYFAESFSPDPTVIARVLATIERWGIERAFNKYQSFYVAQLAQTPESVAWAVRVLQNKYLPTTTPASSQDAPSHDAAPHQPSDLSLSATNVRDVEIVDEDENEESYDDCDTPKLDDLAWRIVNIADATLTRAHERTLFKICRHVGGSNLANLRERWRLCDSSFANLWSDLEHRVRKARKAGKWQSYPEYVEALARYPAEVLPRVIDYLQQAIESQDFESHAYAMSAFLVEVVGRARLHEAADLVSRTYGFNGAVDSERATDALIRLGTPAAIEAVRQRIVENCGGAPVYGPDVLGQIHTDEAVQTGLQLLLELTDEKTLERLADALLAQPSTEIVEAVYALLQRYPKWYEAKGRFGVTCRVVGLDYPEIDTWTREANRPENLFGDEHTYDLIAGMAEALGILVPESLDSENKILHFGIGADQGVVPQLRSLETLQDVHEEEHPVAVDYSTWKQKPARVAYQPQRNDPCPCGSGKKYKKCCLGKDSQT